MGRGGRLGRRQKESKGEELGHGVERGNGPSWARVQEQAEGGHGLVGLGEAWHGAPGKIGDGLAFYFLSFFVFLFFYFIIFSFEFNFKHKFADYVNQ